MKFLANSPNNNCWSQLLVAAAIFLACPAMVSSQIATIGDLNQVYNGTDDPWELGSALLVVGETAEGIMFVFGGSVVNDGQATLGQNSGVVGEATISGDGSQWNHSSGGTFTIGSLGEAILLIDDGAVVTGFRTQIGRNGNGQGTVTLTNGAQWTHAEHLWLASSTNTMATLSIESGSIVSNANGEIGNSSSGTATVTVTGGSQWNNSGTLTVGNVGPGTLLVEDGSVATATDGMIGNSTNGNGNATVTGIGSQWTNTDDMTVARQGNATLEVSDGALVTSLRSIIADRVGSTATATVTGTGSQWNNTSDFFVGGNSLDPGGTGTLNVEDDGFVLVETTMKLWDGGTVNLDGGELDVFRLDLTEPMATDNFNLLPGGRLTLRNEILGDFQQDGGTIALESFTPVDFFADYDMNLGTFSFDIGGTIRGFQYDAIDVVGMATLNGTIAVTLDDFTPSLGSSFQLIDAAGGYSGTPLFDFCSAAFPPASGLAWDTSMFLIDGTISVTTGTANVLLGDINLDCAVDLLDIAPFVALIANGEYQLEADINEDGAVDLLDVGGFVEILSGG